MRPCPNCQCFVPFAAHHCPRCAAALDSGDPHEGGATESRDLVLIGALTGTASNGDAGNGRAPLTGSGHDARADATTQSVLARVMLPPIDGPAGRPRRPSLPKLPQPYAPDPLVLAVFLGIPVSESETHTTDPPETPPTESIDEGGELTTEAVAPDTFSALLGIPREDLRPTAPTAAPPHAPPPHAPLPPAPAPPAAPGLVAVPVATAAVHIEPVALSRGRRIFTRNDPFARNTTRKERILTRVCVLLVLAIATVVIVLRLPLGNRPELSTLVVRDGLTSPVTRTDDPVRLQARVHLRDTLIVAEEVYPTRNTYAAATPDVLNDSLPQLTFVSGTKISSRIGEISVAGSADAIVLAEAATEGECVFARIDGSELPETALLPNGNPCRASSPPKTGWTELRTD